MALVILGITLWYYVIRIKRCKSRERFILNAALCLYVGFTFALNLFQKVSLQWEYGVPGVDMEAYFKGANALSNGFPLNQLGKVDFRLAMNISNIGYLLYVLFVMVVVFTPIIIYPMVTLYICYIIQCIIAIISVLNITEFLTKGRDKARRHILITMLMCVCFMQASAVLMRDIWIVFIISLLMQCLIGKRIPHILCVVLILLAGIIRVYTLVVTVPLYICYIGSKKLAVIASVMISILLIAGSTLLDQIAGIYKILWQYNYKIKIDEILQYFLFPNIINQTYNIFHIETGYHASFGGNNTLIYYMLSVWNILVYPLLAYGIICVIREKRYGDLAIWGLMILNISLLYCVFYEGVSEPRHKLLIIYALMYFSSEGLSRMRKSTYIVWCQTVIIFALGCILTVSLF